MSRCDLASCNDAQSEYHGHGPHCEHNEDDAEDEIKDEDDGDENDGDNEHSMY